MLRHTSRLRLELSHPRWQGVPIFIEAGKRIIDPKRNQEVTEIAVVFKHEEPCLMRVIYLGRRREIASGALASGAPGRHLGIHYISQDPHENIAIRFWAKKPAHDGTRGALFNVDLRKGAQIAVYGRVREAFT